MLQAIFLEKNKEKIIRSLKKRSLKEQEEVFFLIKNLLFLLEDKRKIQLKLDTFFFSFKKISFKIKKFLKKKEKEIDFIKKSILYRKSLLTSVKKELIQKLLKIPNIPHEYVKKGYSSLENEFIYKYGEINYLKQFPHWNLSKKKKYINFELGTKMSGPGFSLFKDKVALLHRAMIEYFLEYNLQGGYIEYYVPFLIKSKSAIDTGQLPEKEKQMYYLYQDNLYLIPTGEIPLMNCYREIILQYNILPLKCTTYTPCFRREAGSYGTKVRGLNRLHQFDKVEIIQITAPEFSYYSLQEMVQHVKKLLISLNLPFRLLRLCGNDLGFTSSITYDFEAYSFAQKKWLEISSISNCRDFQANRLKIQYKKNNKIYICHSLNGSSIAIQRVLAILLENYQTDKYIRIPDILIPYTGFKEIIFH